MSAIFLSRMRLSCSIAWMRRRSWVFLLMFSFKKAGLLGGSRSSFTFWKGFFDLLMDFMFFSRRRWIFCRYSTSRWKHRRLAKVFPPIIDMAVSAPQVWAVQRIDLP